MKSWSTPIRFLAACAALSILAACAGSVTPNPALSNGALSERAAVGSGSGINNGIIYQGCPVFGKTGPYNTVVTKLPIDPNSAQYISSVAGAGDTQGFYASTGVEEINLANNATPLLTVVPKVSYHKFPVPYPWQSYFYIEPLSDSHAMVVQTQTCHLFEAYGTTYKYPTLSAYCGANWDLTQAFAPIAGGNAVEHGVGIVADGRHGAMGRLPGRCDQALAQLGWRRPYRLAVHLRPPGERHRLALLQRHQLVPAAVRSAVAAPRVV